ncbi:hypothetical protein N2152v2_005813 [Parachlorella kessleri]
MELAAPPHSSSDDDELGALLEAEFADEDQGQPQPEEPLAAQEQADSNKRRRLNGSGFMGGLCIRCGAFKDDAAAGAPDTNVALKYIHRGLEISASEAERMRQGTASRVLAGRKLLLMLDLDHTLLNSSRFGEVDEQGEAVLQALIERQPRDAPHIFYLPHMRMWTKLRPGVRQFLNRAHDLFELHIYTMGDREYAAEMARLLDPGGRLFHGRVISSGDTTQRSVKDLDIVLGNENVVLILDDTEGVWPRHRDNLVQIERYTYFPADARRFGLGCQSLLERRMDEDGERGALAVSLRIMAQVHERYFAEDPEGHSDVRRHLSAIRSAVLRGAHVLFSRIIPLDCPRPQAHPLWRLAEDLGAQCSTELCQSVTHVVATDHTDKTRWAKKLGKRVVNPNWLWCSAFTWEHADEARFPVGTGSGSVAAQQVLQRTVEDDLAASLAAAGGGRGETGDPSPRAGPSGSGGNAGPFAATQLAAQPREAEPSEGVAAEQLSGAADAAGPSANAAVAGEAVAQEAAAAEPRAAPLEELKVKPPASGGSTGPRDGEQACDQPPATEQGQLSQPQIAEAHGATAAEPQMGAAATTTHATAAAGIAGDVVGAGG